MDGGLAVKGLPNTPLPLNISEIYYSCYFYVSVTVFNGHMVIIFKMPFLPPQPAQ